MDQQKVKQFKQVAKLSATKLNSWLYHWPKREQKRARIPRTTISFLCVFTEGCLTENVCFQQLPKKSGIAWTKKKNTSFVLNWTTGSTWLVLLLCQQVQCSSLASQEKIVLKSAKFIDFPKIITKRQWWLQWKYSLCIKPIDL